MTVQWWKIAQFARIIPEIDGLPRLASTIAPLLRVIPMEPEQRDKIREGVRRAHYNCPKCNNHMEEVDGSKCDGFPGVRYKVCSACGYARAITKKQRKFKL